MKLATLANDHAGTPDGTLVVVSRDHLRGVQVPGVPTMRDAMERWDEVETVLRAAARALEAHEVLDPVDLARATFLAPLPRTWAWLDGSAFIQHVLLVRKARGAEPPDDLRTVPLMYQGISDTLLGPRADIPLRDPADGLDFEGEVAVVLGPVAMGTPAADAAKAIRLLMVMNDVSLRNLIPRELATGFGFFHGKPASSFAPFAVTPDEAGEAWRDGRLHLRLHSWLNGEPYGRPDAGEMFFSFSELIAHAAATRDLSAGTILGSGTVSNADESVGSSCLAEKRMLEKIRTGTVTTPFMKDGDRIELEVLLPDGSSLCGRIDQRVVPAPCRRAAGTPA
ncbi:MAG: fumarylacetoacetate hydrolase family protein [Candidatus Sericytochromatia bacterium]|nr:fumarylacetoacetate hydrolase family protein [Candidatus Sericytochromatia bacterium]